LEFAKNLVKNGADVNARNNKGTTALHKGNETLNINDSNILESDRSGAFRIRTISVRKWGKY
jgi:ankyrin repeat protein